MCLFCFDVQIFLDVWTCSICTFYIWEGNSLTQLCPGIYLHTLPVLFQHMIYFRIYLGCKHGHKNEAAKQSRARSS